MRKERFEREYNIKVNNLIFFPHRSRLYEVAVVGEYAIYHELKTDDYSVVLDGSVLHWRVDLGSLTAKNSYDQ